MRRVSQRTPPPRRFTDGRKRACQGRRDEGRLEDFHVDGLCSQDAKGQFTGYSRRQSPEVATLLQAEPGLWSPAC